MWFSNHFLSLQACPLFERRNLVIIRPSNIIFAPESDKRFLLTSKFCPLGFSAPDLQLYTFIKSWKDVYKVGGWGDSF